MTPAVLPDSLRIPIRIAGQVVWTKMVTCVLGAIPPCAAPVGYSDSQIKHQFWHAHQVTTFGNIDEPQRRAPIRSRASIVHHRNTCSDRTVELTVHSIESGRPGQ
jgi:hypothetical protein